MQMTRDDATHLALALGAALALEANPRAVVDRALAVLYADAHPQAMRRLWIPLIERFLQTDNHAAIRDALLGLDDGSIARRRQNPFEAVVSPEARKTLTQLADDRPDLLNERNRLARKLPCNHRWKFNNGDPVCIGACGLSQSLYNSRCTFRATFESDGSFSAIDPDSSV